MLNYFKLTSAHIKHYGSPELFHTIGLAERGCYNDPVKDFQLKLYAYRKIEQNIHSQYPFLRFWLHPGICSAHGLVMK